MNVRFDAPQFSAKIDRAGVVQEEIDARMRHVLCTENERGLAVLIRGPDIRDRHGGNHDAFRIAQGDGLAFSEAFGKLRADVERDRYGP